jgi:hypothetical protein
MRRSGIALMIFGSMDRFVVSCAVDSGLNYDQ